MASKESGTPPAPMRSFTRMDSRESVAQSRSNTTSDAMASGIPSSNPASFLANVNDAGEYGDVFEKPASMVSGVEDGNEDVESPMMDPENLPERFEELPIELISLTDRYESCLKFRLSSCKDLTHCRPDSWSRWEPKYTTPRLR